MRKSRSQPSVTPPVVSRAITLTKFAPFVAAKIALDTIAAAKLRESRASENRPTG
jgi:hypothetical protein